jgi:hypothetical protein
MSGIIKVRFKLRIVLWIVLLWSCFDCYEGVIPFEHGLKYMDEVIWFLKKTHAWDFHHVNFNQRDIIFYDEADT